MNEPKYKFADFLRPKTSSIKARKPISIWSRSDKYYYAFCETEIGYAEDELELFQEPQKKKLYAYMNKCGEIRLHVDDVMKWIGDIDDKFNREELYDIEYPEAK